MGKTPDEKITLKEIREVKYKIEQTPVSEEGVILPEATEDPLIIDLIYDIIRSIGGAEHPSGNTGVNKAKLNEFINNALAYTDWKGRGFIKGKINESIFPLGNDTEEGFMALKKIEHKIDQYFAQCNILIFDNRFYDIYFELSEKERAVDLKDQQSITEYLSSAPISKPRTDVKLVFSECTNMLFSEELYEFRTKVIDPIFGKEKESISYDEWKHTREIFRPFEEWQDSKEGESVSVINDDKLLSYLDPLVYEKVEKIIHESSKTEALMDDIRLIEKLLLYQRWILEFINNYVCFPRLYNPERRAMFEMGTLVMDGRKFNLSVRVDDTEQHIKSAKYSNFFTLYCNIRKNDKILYRIAVPVTSGTRGSLYKGKPGLFMDITNNEYEARVFDIIENPISLAETVLHPFRRVLNIITSRIEEMSRSAEDKLVDTLSSSDTYRTEGDDKPESTGSVQKRQTLIGVLAGGGIAFAAIGSSLAFIVKTVSQLSLFAILGTITGAILLFILPVIISSIIKLRKRDLNPILEASGWAINTNMRLTRKQAKFFTQKPKYRKIKVL